MKTGTNPHAMPESRIWPLRRALLLLGALVLTAFLVISGFKPPRVDATAESASLPAVSAGDEAPAAPPPARRRQAGPPSAERLAEYAAHRPKTIFELQLHREAVSQPVVTAEGAGRATLTSLSPSVNAWFVLELELPAAGGYRHAVYHLENPDPEHAEIALDVAYPHGLVIRGGGAERPCDLWSAEAAPRLADARAAGRTYAELCAGGLYLRNVTEGRKTRLEMATDLLRDSGWGGEQITTFVRQNLYQDRFLETSELIPARDATGRPRPPGAPRRPLVDPRYEGHYLAPAELGLELDNETPGKVLLGRWYAVRGQPGVFVSTIQARLVAPEVVAGLKGRLNPLDEVESAALVYMVAFDLAAFDVGFALGTDHPRVTWSERALATVRDDALPGPDGIGTVAPLVRTGRVSPVAARRVAATFTGGFKRNHGAFKYTALATANSGSHYGFVESGVVASKLVPGLATAVVWDDGTVELKTWTQAADAELGRVRHARQNGVPIIEQDAATGASRPGALVPRWGEGNWSGSQEKRLRTLRAGLCLQESAAAEASDAPADRFLIYGYFSGATPSAMAQVFQAYGCRYAMLLDMNALEHTYLALYRRQGGNFLVQHLIEGMDVLDEALAGQKLPRFVAFADNRDFFYLLRRQDPR